MKHPKILAIAVAGALALLAACAHRAGSAVQASPQGDADQPAPPPTELWMRGDWDPMWDAGSAVPGVNHGGSWSFVLGSWPPGPHLFKFTTALVWPTGARDPQAKGLWGSCGKDMAKPAASGESCTTASMGGLGGNLNAVLNPNTAVEFTPANGRWLVRDPGAVPALPAQSPSALWLRGAWSNWDAAGAIAGVASGHEWTFKLPATLKSDEWAFQFASAAAAGEAGAVTFGSCHGYDFVAAVRKSAACPDAVAPSGKAGKLMARLRPGEVVRFNDQTGAWSVSAQ